MKRTLLWATAGWLAATGCARLAPEPEMPAGPVLLAPDDPLPATLLAGLDTLSDERVGLRAGVVLRLERADGSQRMSQSVVLERPSRLRMEIQSFLTTVAVLVSDGSRYDYFQSHDRYREQGPVHPLLLWNIAGIPLTLDQTVSFLLGTPPVRGGLEVSSAVREPDGAVRIELIDPRGAVARTVLFDSEGRLRHTEDRTKAGGVRWEVGYDRYREVGEAVFPHTVDIHFPPMATRARVSFKGVELNPQTSDETFVLRFPGEGDGDG